MISALPVTHINDNIYTAKAEDNGSKIKNVSINGVLADNKSKGINVAYRTVDEIRRFVKKHPSDFYSIAKLEEKPIGRAPYSLGRLDKKTMQSALNTINQIRYIAGLSSNVVLNENYIKLAQGASVVSAVNGKLSHTPSKPYGMSDVLYRLGAEGAAHSNLAMGYTNIDSGIVLGYMNDGDSTNIDRIGHRRWILNPSMKSIGFGFYNNFSATYAHDGAFGSSPEYGVIWPAMNMPTEYINSDFPWSISLGYEVNPSDVKVELTRYRDNKIWQFSKAHSDGYFNVNNVNYGLSGCIIFRPDGIKRYANGERFGVKITGLSEPISYEVSFFDLEPVTGISLSKVPKTIKIGEHVRLNIRTLPSSASDVVKIKVDSNVLSLGNDKNGEVFEYDYEKYCRANKYGTAKITVSTPDGRIIKSKKVTVVPNNVYVYASSSSYNKASKRGKLKLQVSKNDSVSGYEVVFAKNKKFRHAKKMISNSPKKTKFMINKAQAGKTYYVKVRAFVKVGGKKIYGNYSKPGKYRIY
jgi:hypothetical protein